MQMLEYNYHMEDIYFVLLMFIFLFMYIDIYTLIMWIHSNKKNNYIIYIYPKKISQIQLFVKVITSFDVAESNIIWCARMKWLFFRSIMKRSTAHIIVDDIINHCSKIVNHRTCLQNSREVQRTQVKLLSLLVYDYLTKRRCWLPWKWTNEYAKKSCYLYLI